MKLLVAGLTPCLLTVYLFSQSPGPQRFDQIVAAYQQGRLDEAEKLLRSLLSDHPSEIRALSLMGVVLDGQKRFAEAESFYLKAIRQAPDSATLQNNLGNHYSSRGEIDKAQQAFLRALTIDPHHVNAGLQLAQILLQKRDFAAVLSRLDRLPPAEQASAPVQLSRVRALCGSGQKEEAQKLLTSLESRISGDPSLTFALGMAYVDMERFSDAESAFTRVLQADPINFEVLYNLGTAALRAGHLERALAVYQRALELRPADVDGLVGLARTLAASSKEMQALPLLVEANKSAPKRTDILLLMAQTVSTLGLYGDAAAAYDKYLKLKPDDDVARRERGYSLTLSSRVKEGMRDLEWYAKKHPDDTQGHFRLAVALSIDDKAGALEQINLALQLEPQFWEAKYARGVLSQRLGKTQEAVSDLQDYLKHDPANVQAHEELARALLQNRQPQAAAEILNKAIALAPSRSSLYFHYIRAMRALGRVQEMNDAIARFEQLGGGKENVVPRSGLFEFLSLSPAEQRNRYIANLRDSILQRPTDRELRLRLIEAYLMQGRVDEARPILAQIKELSPDSRILAHCGSLLVDNELYEDAVPFIDAAIAKGSPPDRTFLDQALTTLHTTGADKALAILNGIPTEKQDGDYHLLRAQILDSLGRFPEAVVALNEALRAAPTRVDLYSQACSFLIKHRRFEECLQLIKQAAKYVPDSPELMLARAIVLEWTNQTYEATQELQRIQAQWPEWSMPYVIQGIILESQHQAAEARQLLETAITLDSGNPAAYYHLALAIKELTPSDNKSAYAVVTRGLKLDPEDPYMQAEAGKIALDMKDYPLALGHLKEAIRLYPDMADAHWLLATLYRITGENEKQRLELAEVTRLNKLFPPGTQTPPSMQDLLFSVRRPRTAAGQSPGVR
ncbi:MAG TPA: tetratricopeptide repeat protein [Acidobacteriota bacterium]|nr:tetratricopeptide repeat protein [Acidobacteriota bacterium]